MRSQTHAPKRLRGSKVAILLADGVEDLEYHHVVRMRLLEEGAGASVAS